MKLRARTTAVTIEAEDALLAALKIKLESCQTAPRRQEDYDRWCHGATMSTNLPATLASHQNVQNLQEGNKAAAVSAGCASDGTKVLGSVDEDSDLQHQRREQAAR